jgi:secondary thiamine-phosphate synthase enzyme
MCNDDHGRCWGRGSAVAEIVQASHVLTVATRGKGFIDITRELARWLESLAAENGLLTVFVRHTSASLTIQENADPNVRRDLLDALEVLAPEDRPYAHQEEGPDDMPSHIKTMLTSISLGIPVKDGSMALGTWQGVYLIEHRASPHQRSVVLNFIGEAAAA